MFGEELSESPRLPSPWASVNDSPSEFEPPIIQRRPSQASADLRRRASFATLVLGLNSISLAETANHPSMRSPSIQAEVDGAGHIEYKLKLPNPSPLRLQKLTTQLKWRIVQGGGSAVYEIGILDDGIIVGLSRQEMVESLETLGKMLGGIGGGEVRVSRVVRLGGTESDDSSDESTFDDIEVAPDLEQEGDLFTFSLGSASKTRGAPQELKHLDFTPPIQFLARTPEERSLHIAAKREQRQLRRELEGDHRVLPCKVILDEQHHDGNPKSVKPPKLIPVKAQYRPEPENITGEARYVVEAVVMNRSLLRKERAKQRSDGIDNEKEGNDTDHHSDLERDDETDLNHGEEDEEEGWSYLDFASIGLNDGTKDELESLPIGIIEL